MTVPEPADSGAGQDRRISVVVADDHPVVRSGIVYELEQQPDIDVLGAAEDGDAALRLARTLQPDVLVLDLSMPGLAAVEVVRQVRALPLAPRVLMLTAHGEPEQILALLQAGATGYVLKNEHPAAISAAVRVVAQGGTWLSQPIMDKLVHVRTVTAYRADEAVLTEVEVAVLRLVAQGKRDQEIGPELGIAERTGRKYLSSICAKLQVESRIEAAVQAIRYGLI